MRARSDLVPWFRSPAWPVAAIALLLAFVFLGARPIWDPDEGRYTNVALQMLDSGDWVDLARHHETGHWTKPLLTCWSLPGWCCSPRWPCPGISSSSAAIPACSTTFSAPKWSSASPATA